MGVKQPVALS